MYWNENEIVAVENCAFENDYTKATVLDLLNPACTDDVLLFGVPGTGKSTLLASIACEREGVSQLNQTTGIEYYNCKSTETRNKIGTDELKNSLRLTSLSSECPIYIFDEIDRLTSTQQDNLIEFMDYTNRIEQPCIIMGSCNTLLYDAKARNKAFQAALLSRFDVKLQIKDLPAARYLNLVQSYLKNASVSMSDTELLALLNTQEKRICAQEGCAGLNYRAVRAITNRLIRTVNTKKAA